MRNLIFLAVIIAFGLLQATVFNYVSIFNVKPDLLLISAIIASIFFASGWAIFFSVFAGVLKDILSANAFGINTMLFFTWSFLIIRLSRKISFDMNYVRLSLLVIAVIFNNIVMRLIYLFWGNFVSLGIFLRIVFIDSLYCAFILFLILKFTSPFLTSD